MSGLDQAGVDREFLVLSRQFNRRVDASGERPRLDPLRVVALVLAVEVLLVAALFY